MPWISELRVCVHFIYLQSTHLFCLDPINWNVINSNIFSQYQTSYLPIRKQEPSTCDKSKIVALKFLLGYGYQVIYFKWFSQQVCLYMEQGGSSQVWCSKPGRLEMGGHNSDLSMGNCATSCLKFKKLMYNYKIITIKNTFYLSTKLGLTPVTQHSMCHS